MAEHDGVDVQIDNLSSIGRKLLRFNFNDKYRRLVVDGDGDEDARAMLETLKPADLLGVPVTDHNHAAGVLAGMWLWHDWLDEAHRICQAIETPTGSFWHAIMHRREGDFSNSKYWYNRVGEHPVYASIAAHAGTLLNPLPMDKPLVRLTHNGWNPHVLVDLVQEAVRSGDESRKSLLANLQQIEWRMLFDHCVREATARN